jgi:hypothetical protein
MRTVIEIVFNWACMLCFHTAVRWSCAWLSGSSSMWRIGSDEAFHAAAWKGKMDFTIDSVFFRRDLSFARRDVVMVRGAPGEGLVVCNELGRLLIHVYTGYARTCAVAASEVYLCMVTSAAAYRVARLLAMLLSLVG